MFYLAVVIVVLIRVRIAAGFERRVQSVLALLHLPVVAKVASVSCCALFFSPCPFTFLSLSLFLS